MDKELTSAEKCRRTKLGNKTSEELIDVIVRKDDIGRRKDKLITCLKNNIVGLERKVESIKTDLANVESEYADSVDKYNALYKTYSAEVKHNAVLQENFDTACNHIDSLNKKLDKAVSAAIKIFFIGVFLGSIIAAVINYLF